MITIESKTYTFAAMAGSARTRNNILDALMQAHALMQAQLASQAAFQGAMPLMPDNADREHACALEQSAWLRRAEEFRDDLAPSTILSAGEPHNISLIRMITNGQYVELMRGMHEFVLDLPTQVAILRLLHQHLDIPNQPERSAANAVEASCHNMHYRIALSMRFHAQDLQLQLLGIEVMSHLKSNSSYNHTEVLYIVAALLPVLHRHPQQSSWTANWHEFIDARVHVNCFRITVCVTAQATTPWIMVDGHNIFTVIIQSLQLHPRDHMLTLVCTQLLQQFVLFIRTQDD